MRCDSVRHARQGPAARGGFNGYAVIPPTPITQEGPKIPIRRPQEAPKRAQERVPGRPKRPQEAPRGPQEAPKRSPRGPQEATGVPKEVPKKHPKHFKLQFAFCKRM